MAFNFKNNNLTIILLLILVIGSSMCYLMMEKSIEGFSLKGFQPTITNNFTSIGGVPGKIDRNYLILNESKRYVLNSNPYPSAISELESTGDFNFRNKVGKDLSYNAFLYQTPPRPAPPATTNDISYDLYNLQLNETYDLSSLPAGTGSTTEGKNADLSGTTNILMVIDSSGYFYDVSGNNRRLGFNLILDKDYLIFNGELRGSIPTDIGLSSSTGSNTSNVNLGDINFKDMFKGLNNGQLPPNMTPEMAAYMMQGSMGSGNQGYTMPFYNNFESAMNNPSNPLVNPTNAMNPLQYNQSLFGPNVSPMMSQNMCKNSSADKGTKVREDDKKDSKSKDSTINTTFDKLNSSANTMLAQNTGTSGNENNSQNSSGNPPPCPPCARCPESNYECKKVPAYEQGYENTALPRPVLSDFSTFGM